MEKQLTALREALAKQKERRSQTAQASIWKGGLSEKSGLKSYAADVLAQKNAAIKAKKGYTGIGKEVDSKRSMLEKAIDLHKKELKTSLKPAQISATPTPPPNNAFIPTSPRKQVSATPKKMWTVPEIPDTPIQTPQTTLPQLHPTPLRPARTFQIYTPPPSYTIHVSKQSNKKQEIDANDTKNTTGNQHTTAESDNAKDSSLFGGSFNETESHQSFLDALNEWRSQRTPEVKNTPDNKRAESSGSIIENGTDSMTMTDPEPTNPESHSQIDIQQYYSPETTLSYADKLLLQKLRSNSATNKTTDTPITSKTPEALEIKDGESDSDDAEDLYFENVYKSQEYKKPQVPFKKKKSILTITEISE
ncbi:hypothetical protein HK098_001939 [Nowakowskiella sp. JEL0407]|nr:hypothetical protein HK098_001939 [Nowakowskiella sp. JEL0407]